MKISYNWLKEFLKLEDSPYEIAQKLTFLGIETSVAQKQQVVWDKVITAKVVEVNKHPQADKLSVCLLSDGINNYSVVCGASNVAAGQIVPLAIVGAILPDGLKIKKAKLRGIESEGMICSKKELALAEESSGIMVFPESTAIGKPIEDILYDSDSILDIEVTTNRPDCLSHWGIARELAAVLKQQIKMPQIFKSNFNENIKINVVDFDLCSRYIGCFISGVQVKQSPDWLIKKIEKCGLRPINNIVDITNYVLMELGHPLHAFDADLMTGNEIIVRKANKDEKILALDGKEYTLLDYMPVISDVNKAQAIAGIIGGESSGVNEKTKNIFLESAIFNSSIIRKTSKNLNISTDASYRFERGSAWEVAELVSWRAITLISEIAGGKLVSRKDCYTRPYSALNIDLRPSRIEKILGLKINIDEIKEILNNLGLKVSENNQQLKVEIPSWRLDIKDEIDLIEEIARINGYDKIRVTIMPVIPSFNKDRSALNLENLISKKLTCLGFSEAMNISFSEESELKKLFLESFYKISNPMSKENEVLRPSLLPGLLKNIILNTRQGYNDIKFFEIGTIFTENEEKKSFAFIAKGMVWPEWWQWEGKKNQQIFDFYFFSGIINNILSGNKINFIENKNPKLFFHPKKNAAIEFNGNIVGNFGILKSEYNQEDNIEICYCEIDFNLLEKYWSKKEVKYNPLKRYPFVKRDLSLLAPKNLNFAAIDTVLQGFISISNSILLKYNLFSRYEDEKIGNNNICYSIHLFFRHADHTLTDSEVNKQIDEIVNKLNKESGISLR